MSHLLPRIPMGEHTQTLTYAHTGSHTFRWCHAHLATIMPKTQQYALAPGQKSFLSQQPSPAFTTTRLLKSKKKKKIPKWHWFNCVPHNTASYSGSLRKHSSSFATLQNSRQKKKRQSLPGDMSLQRLMGLEGKSWPSCAFSFMHFICACSKDWINMSGGRLFLSKGECFNFRTN